MPNLAETQDRVGALMNEILACFKPGRKIAVIVRSPDAAEQDFMMTNDTLADLRAVIERRAEAVGETITADIDIEAAAKRAVEGQPS